MANTKCFGRYLVKVGSFKGGKRFDVLDKYFDRSDYAFSKEDGTLYSYSPLAVSFVKESLGDFVKKAQTGKCYIIYLTDPFGTQVKVEEVPMSWYHR